MGKKYLNYQERMEMLTLSGIMTFAKDKTEDKRTKKEQMPFFKYIKTYAEKIINKVLDDLDEDEKEYLIQTVDKTVISCYYTDEATRKHKEMMAIDANVVLSSEETITLGNAVVASCAVCEFKGEDVKNCETRKILLKMGIQPFENHGECPFRID